MVSYLKWEDPTESSIKEKHRELPSSLEQIRNKGRWNLLGGMLREFIPVACFLGEARSKVCHRERE
jgi:hypothetical protein